MGRENLGDPMMMDLLDIAARWLHVMGILVWMGHNFANVIQNPTYQMPSPTAPAADLEAKFDAAMRREHGTFRYASLIVLFSGLFMLVHKGTLLETLTLSGGHAVLGMGVWTGTIMVLNLWFVLWPHQKKVIGFTPASFEERVQCSRITFLSSRTNTILTFPTVLFMASGSHASFLFG